MPVIQYFSLTLTFIVMILALAGMVYFAKFQRSRVKAQLYVICLLGVVIVCAIVILPMTMLGFFGSETVRSHDINFVHSAAIVLGRRIAEKYPYSNAVIIAVENYENNERQMELIEGLKEGFDEKVTVKSIEVPLDKNGNPVKVKQNQAYMLRRERDAGEINRIIGAHPDCEIVVSLIELPRNVGELYVWKMEEQERPMFFLFFPAEPQYLKRAILGGYLWALIRRPDRKPKKEACPSDPEEAFDKKFVILTKENVKEFDEKHKGFFK